MRGACNTEVTHIDNALIVAREGRLSEAYEASVFEDSDKRIEKWKRALRQAIVSSAVECKW